jgi:hypothetical protein
MMAGLFGLGTAIAGLWMPAVAAFANVLLALAMARIVRQQRCKTEKV